MGQKIVVGPLNKGMRNDVTPFNLDADSFPVLINAYQWRSRVKRKRGTSFLTRFRRVFVAFDAGTPFGAGTSYDLNLFTLLGINATEPNASIVPGSVQLQVDNPSFAVFDDNGTGVLVPSLQATSPSTINFATGDVHLEFLSAPGARTLFISLREYPGLPVMGLEDFDNPDDQFPETIGFDTRYAYNINTFSPFSNYNVTYYKNPPLSPTNPAPYVPKAFGTPFNWNGEDYQQIWSTNYQGALWVTNGIKIPFQRTNIGMQYGMISAMTITSATATNGPSTVDLTIVGNPLIIGDFVYINEVVYTAPNTTNSINYQTGYVTNVVGDVVTVYFPHAYLTGTYSSGGIAQYLTNTSDPIKDGIRFYDGDPTNGNATTPVINGSKGWVNFAPPLSQSPFSIAGLPEAIYYLVGARIILPFKDRLLFIGPVVQTSAASSQRYLQDTVIYSQNGTPYYTSSFTGDVDLPTTQFFPMLVPDDQSATGPAWFEDSTGFGGFQSAAVDEPIVTAAPNEDVLIMGFNPSIQARFVYTGNDIIPFNFFLTNSELGAESTFSAINMDKGVITKGPRGFTITSQSQATRIDLEIPDEVFSMNLLQNGPERMCAQRDFENEWIYFTYPYQQFITKFPNRTLQFNYRDNSWAMFNECYTHYGSFRKRTGYTWATIGEVFPTWAQWNEPWNAGSTTLIQPMVIAGNQQGFVVCRDDGTGESNSLFIQNIASNVITSANHGLNPGDYIVISGAIGTIASTVNGKIYSVAPTVTDDTFTLNPPNTSGTYLGGGLIKRMYVPLIQTMQFPTAWEMARKTRIGVQQYLFTTTDDAQITLQIYLSQNADNPYNSDILYPNPNATNDSLVFSSVLYTCPESTNLGLSPANTNLQMVTAKQQAQIWHRMNTSLLGDTVQIGFTLSDAQMRSTNADGIPINQFAEIELHGFILDVTPSMVIA